jgi:transposase
MMYDLRDDRLEEWMAAVDAADLPALRSFVIGLRRDQDAVTACLTLSWNSGPVEGHINRIKMINGRCMDEPTPPCSTNASCSPTDVTPWPFTKTVPDPAFKRR